MDGGSLAAWVDAQDDLIGTFRAGGRRGSQDPVVGEIPPERTTWIDEQRALLETCALGDLSHHMTAVHLEGPDATAFLAQLCLNDVEDFPIGRAKQVVMCSPDGYLVGDGPVLRLGESEYYSAGLHGTKWLKFNAERGDDDVSVDIEPPTPLLGGDPPARFVYQLQGPATDAVLERVTDDPLEDLDFFAFREVDLAGRDVIAFGHGMSPEAGYELIGAYEDADVVRSALLEAGRDLGVRELGRRSYVAQSTKVGWVPPWPKPVYTGEAMAAYRDWVDVEAEHAYGKAYWTTTGTLESSFSIEGSLASDDVTDYYLDPVEVGYGKLVDLDHEFVGRAALERSIDAQRRTLVSLVWDPADVARVHGSILGAGPVHKGLGSLPLVRRATMPYDVVHRDGEPVGVSYTRSYQWDLRTVVSLCAIDVDCRRPGTDVSVRWGEPDGRSPNPAIEDHTPTDVAASVRPAPYKAKEK